MQVEQKQRKWSSLSKFEKKKACKKCIANIISAVVWVLGASLLILCASNLYQQMFNADGYTGFFGVGTATVASQSMDPTLKEDDLIFYTSSDGSDIKIGDIAIYKKQIGSQEVLIVHTVIDYKDGMVLTKGDNNAMPDDPFPASMIVGKYLFKMRGIGVLLSLMQDSPLAGALLILALAAFYVIRIISYIANKRRIIKNITAEEANREAISHFFDV